MSPNWWNWYSAYLSALGRLDEAEAAIRKSIELRPRGSSAWAQLAIIEIQRGDANAAIEAAGREPEGVWRDIARAMALQAGKDRAAADAALEKLVADYGDVAAFQIAQVQALRRDDKAVIAVRDHGPGIAPNELPHVFDRYWSGRPKRGGAGLGLAIAKGIVDAHGGAITVDSQQGDGAKFLFTLPLARR